MIFAGLVHNLAYFLGVCEGQAAPQHRKILRVHKARSPVDLAVSGHHAVARVVLVLHVEVGAAVFL